MAAAYTFDGFGKVWHGDGPSKSCQQSGILLRLITPPFSLLGGTREGELYTWCPTLLRMFLRLRRKFVLFLDSIYMFIIISYNEGRRKKIIFFTPSHYRKKVEKRLKVTMIHNILELGRLNLFWTPMEKITLILNVLESDKSKEICVQFSMIQGVFLTGTPPKSSKYKKVNLG